MVRDRLCVCVSWQLRKSRMRMYICRSSNLVIRAILPLQSLQQPAGAAGGRRPVIGTVCRAVPRHADRKESSKLRVPPKIPSSAPAA